MLINRRTLQLESNLAQLGEDEAERIEAERITLFQQDETFSQQDENKRIRLFQRFAQARVDEETALETKAHDYEYNQFFAWKNQAVSTHYTTVRKTTYPMLLIDTIPTLPNYLNPTQP